MDNVAKLSHQEAAEQVLQIYTKTLQDLNGLKSILSEFCILDYFGKFFYGHDKVASHLITNLHGSSYELSSLTISNSPGPVQWEPISKTLEKPDKDIGIEIISPPKPIFPSLAFLTPVRRDSPVRKRSLEESPSEDCTKKLQKMDCAGEHSNVTKKPVLDSAFENAPGSPQTLRSLYPDDIRYLTACGTIRYPKRILPMTDTNRIKHHSLARLRDRFCQLHIGFECDEHVIGVTNCKIWTIKYSVSSRVTPRNLLKLFNEVDGN